MELPSATYYGPALKAAVQAGTVSMDSSAARSASRDLRERTVTATRRR